MQRIKIAATVGIILGVAAMVLWAWLQSKITPLDTMDISYLHVFIAGFVIGTLLGFVWPRS